MAFTRAEPRTFDPLICLVGYQAAVPPRGRRNRGLRVCHWLWARAFIPPHDPGGKNAATRPAISRLFGPTVPKSFVYVSTFRAAGFLNAFWAWQTLLFLCGGRAGSGHRDRSRGHQPLARN